MPSLRMSLVTFLGAVVADLMALSAAMKSGRLNSGRWRRPVTYAGMALQGLIACGVRAVLVNGSADPVLANPVFAFSLGANLPLFLEKLAVLSPKLAQSALPREAGFGEVENGSIGSSLENLRQLLAKER